MLRTFKATTALATIFALGGCTAILGISSDPQIADAGPPANTEAGAGDGATGTCVGTLYVRIASDFSGTATDIKTSKTGHVTITVVQGNGVRFKTLAKNVVVEGNA